MGVAALRSVPAQTCGSETEWDWEKSFHQCREPSCRLGGGVQAEFVMLVAKDGGFIYFNNTIVLWE